MNCMLNLSISLSWRFRFATSLFLISSLVEDHSKSLSRSGVIDIPFTELWQWLTLFLSRKIKKRQSKLNSRAKDPIKSLIYEVIEHRTSYE